MIKATAERSFPVAGDGIGWFMNEADWVWNNCQPALQRPHIVAVKSFLLLKDFGAHVLPIDLVWPVQLVRDWVVVGCSRSEYGDTPTTRRQFIVGYTDIFSVEILIAINMKKEL